MNLKLKNPLAFFDLETTGIHVAGSDRRNIHFENYSQWRKGSTTERINPGIPIPPETSLIHGIYDEDVRDTPSFKELEKPLSGFSRMRSSRIQHFSFDVPMLVEEFLGATSILMFQKENLLIVKNFST